MSRLIWLGWWCALLPVLAGCSASQDAGGADVVARSVRSSVQLFTERDDARRRAGSAVVLATDPASGRTLILTTAHLFEPPIRQAVFATTAAAKERRPATIIAIDADVDLAVVETEGLAVAPAAMETEVHLGDSVWVVSFPWGRRLTVVDGVVSQVDQHGDDALPITGPVSLIDAPVSYGTSGGGVYDHRTGRLIGVVRGYRTAKLSVSGSVSEPLEVPVGGETTVISTLEILCFLKAANLGDLAADLRRQIEDSDC